MAAATAPAFRPGGAAVGKGGGGATKGTPAEISVFESQDAYLSELLSYSLERLNKEPELLRADAERVQRQMQDVVVGQYSSFITAAECVRTVSTEVRSLEAHLQTLLDGLPALREGCDSFSDRAHEVVEKRGANKMMLANHGTLLDLLEVPQLLDTCVRNGNYDEALDLEAFISKAAVTHSEVPVVHGLVQEVRQSTGQMLQQLLQRLSGAIQLPECLRVIGYLRRLAVFSEHSLRLQFLQCRELWLQGLVDELDTSHPYEYLKKLTDVHRVHLFDVVMQYRAIFSDDASSAESAEAGSDGGLLFSWAMHRVGSYLDMVRELLPRVSEGGSIASVLEHCMYCGMSLGRVGLDFRGLLAPIFESCIFDLAAKSLAGSVELFHHMLNTHKWVALPSIHAHHAKESKEGGHGGAGGGGEDGADGEAEEDLAPPYSLMEHPPLAVFANGVLAALNELRHCAPAALRVPLGNALQSALNQVSTALSHFLMTRAHKESETRLIVATCCAMGEVCAPYLVACYRRVFPGGAGAGAVNMSLALEPLQPTIDKASGERKRQQAAAAAQAEKEAEAAKAEADKAAKDKAAMDRAQRAAAAKAIRDKATSPAGSGGGGGGGAAPAGGAGGEGGGGGVMTAEEKRRKAAARAAKHEVAAALLRSQGKSQ